jgi:AP-4 complex subunit mu-1
LRAQQGIILKYPYWLLIICNRFNVSPSSIVELLNRMAKVFKDYCGVLTEESIRQNFTLIYELLDEMLDYGYPQMTQTENLKNFIHNDAVVVKPPISSSLSVMQSLGSKTKSSTASNLPIATGANRSSKQKNEIYVDIIERISVLFNANGNIVTSAVDGTIQMKSFLSGNPELRLALNEDLVIGKGSGYGSVILDDCNFHECVRLDEFEQQRTLHFIPPEGEFAVLNYRVTGDIRCPFKIFPAIEEPAPYKVEVMCMIRAEIPDGIHSSNIVINIPVPRATTGCVFEMSSQLLGSVAEYNAGEKRVIWTVKKLVGGSEIALRAKITLDQLVTPSHKREIGPIAMSFDIPMHNVTNLQVRYLRISETHKEYNPYRWVRYMTVSSSYVCRI